MEFNIGDLVRLDLYSFYSDGETQDSRANPANVGLVVGFDEFYLFPRIEWIVKPFNWAADVTWEDGSELLLLSGDKDGI